MSAVAKIWRFIHAVRFSLLFTALFAVLAISNDQVRDLLWILAEAKVTKDFEREYKVTLLFVSALFMCWNAFQWASYALYWRHTASDTLAEWEARLEEWGPRVLGVVPLVALAVGFGVARAHHESTGVASVRDWLLGLALVSAILSVLTFLFFIVIRARFMRDWRGRRDAAVAALRAKDPSNRGKALPLAQLNEGIRLQMLLYVLSAGLVVLGLTLWPVDTAHFLGSMTLLLLWLGGMIGVFTVLGYTSDRFGVPVVGALMGLAILFSLEGWNDNHGLRTVDESVLLPDRSPYPGASPDSSELDRAVAEWLEKRVREAPDASRFTEDNPFPVFIASAEGGGIRAGFWTGYVLARLQDRFPKLSNHLLAISSVSGGSLGAGVFTSTLASVKGQKEERGSGEDFSQAHETYFSRGFLSPVLGGFLFSDLLQRFVPVAIPYLDRARAFEEGLEAAASESWGRENTPMTRAVNALYTGPASEWPPLLLLNTTRVETGQWGMVTPFALPRDIFADTVDLSCLAARIPLSTGIHLTARFPLVSPAGLVNPDDTCAGLPKTRQRYVDGGYYDNSGVRASSRLARVVRRVALERKLPIRIAFLHFSNNPKQGDFYEPHVEAGRICGIPPRPPDPNQGAPRYSYFMGDTLSPIRAMLNVQGTSGDTHLWDFAQEALEGCREPNESSLFLRFRVPPSETDLPLGWALASISKAEMRAAINGCSLIGPTQIQREVERRYNDADTDDDIKGNKDGTTTCESVKWVGELLGYPPAPGAPPYAGTGGP
jgi:hypothetical protein